MVGRLFQNRRSILRNLMLPSLGLILLSLAVILPSLGLILLSLEVMLPLHGVSIAYFETNGLPYPLLCRRRI